MKFQIQKSRKSSIKWVGKNIGLFILSIFMLGAIQASAQVPIMEKSYDVSRKAKNGYLAHIETNEAKGTIDMIYVLSSTTKHKIKYEIYTYDKDLNLINTVQEEEFIDKVKTRWSWFNFKGDSFVTNSLTASSDLMGKLVFRKKQTTGTWLWLTGTYYRNIKQLEKVKPKSEDNMKFFYVSAYEIERDSSVLVIAGKPEKKTHNETMKFDIMSCDNEVNITTVDKIEFPYPQKIVFSAPLQDDLANVSNDDLPRDWIVLFAPSGLYNKESDPKPTNYTYIRISTKGKVIEKFNFNSPSNGWRVLGAYEKDNSVFLYGSAITKNPTKDYSNDVFKNLQMVATTSASASEKEEENNSGSGVLGGVSGISSMGSRDNGATQEDVDIPLDELKYTNIQIGKITNSKFDFLSSPGIEEFEKKQAKPADQKKFITFDGKKFEINGINFSSAGDIFISGQDFTTSKKGRIYKGVYMFQFEANGNLKRNYGVKLDQSSKSSFFNKSPLTSDMYIAHNSILESSDKKSLYWLIQDVKSIREESSSSFASLTTVNVKTTWTPLYQYEYGNINIADGELSDFKGFGNSEKKEFYLFPNTGSYQMDHYLFFFSETMRGDEILLTRMDLSK
ncbi:MAG: hypothetical protein IPH88_08055 [Bacteroidales bacterium]|nr:hypothetical protein [Bacteroidales bacterium]